MSAAAANANEGEYVLFCDRPEWSDVTPVPQDDGPMPACPIAYADDFRDAMDYYRAILKSGEVSERALELTAAVVDLNPANYAAWHTRRELLQKLGSDLREELAFVSELIMDSPKNYQVWYHRQAIVSLLNDPSQELAFTEAAFATEGSDYKNYHCWSHRQWAMAKYTLFESAKGGGLDLCDRLLDADPRNNSAWSHRFFVRKHTSGFTDEVVQDEVTYCLARLARAPNNESAWNYLKGVVRVTPAADDGADVEEKKKKKNKLGDYPEIKALCLRLSESGVPSVYVLGCLIDVYEEEVLAAAAGADNADEARAAACELCERLGTKIDEVRARYWAYRKSILMSSGS